MRLWRGGELREEAELYEGESGGWSCYCLECYSYKLMILDKIYNLVI